MPTCCANGCKNQSNKNSSVSYHELPCEKNALQRKAWIAAIGRVSLPKNVHLCSEHFHETCFESTACMKVSICSEEYPNIKKTRKRLIQNAVPTIFHHKPEIKLRESSLKRIKRKEQDQVISTVKICYLSISLLKNLYLNLDTISLLQLK